ncbi:MAG: cupin domain-containing protein [Cyanobium sp. ELA507]
MAPNRQIEILPIEPVLRGHTFLSVAPQGDETLIAEVAPSRPLELLCHRHQTSQLRVLRGALDLVVLQNRRFHSIALREDEATWLVIPPGIPHASINRGCLPAVLVNAVLHHAAPAPTLAGKPRRAARRIPPALLEQWQELVG